MCEKPPSANGCRTGWSRAKTGAIRRTHSAIAELVDLTGASRIVDSLSVKREHTLKSLVVEDDATSRKLLSTYLSRHRICDIAVDGVEAVNAVHRACQSHQAYDLVCMDLRMPQMDGQEAFEKSANRKQRPALRGLPESS
jgi:PleD family two-component response regulator